jgi:hypothetical protein
MNQPTSEFNRQSRRRFFIIIFLLFTVSITLLTILPPPTLGSSSNPSSASSSSSSVTTTSSDASAMSSSSSSVSSSSEVSSSTPSSSSSSLTSSSSASSSSSDPSSSSSSNSENPLGPRLSKLNAVESLQILGSLKVGQVEYFIWQDTSKVKISHFIGDNLEATSELGASGSVFFSGQLMTQYSNGILFTMQSMSGQTTYFYNETGIVNTLTDTAIVPTSTSLASAVHVSKLVGGSPELHTIDGSNPTISTKVLTLSANLFVGYFSDVYTMGAVNVDISENFRIITGFDTSINQPVIEFYETTTFTKILTFSMMSPNRLAVTENAIFVANLMTMNVTRYSSTGSSSAYTMAVMFHYPYDQGVVIEQMMSQTITLFHDGIEFSTHNNKFHREVANNEDDGSAFLLVNTDFSGFYTYSFSEANGLVQGGFFSGNVEISSYTNVPPQFKSFNEVANTNVVGYYHQGWTILETYGQIDDYYEAFVNINGTMYAIKIDPIATADPDAFEISLYHGGVGENQVLKVSLDDLNIKGWQLLGQVNQYLIMNISVGSNITTYGYVIDLADRSYQALPETIWYMGTANTSTFRAKYYEQNGVIHGWTDLGSISFDLSDIAGTFTSTTNGANDTDETVQISLHEDVFGVNDDLVMVFTSPFPNPNNESFMQLYRGDIANGLASLTLLADATIDATSLYALGLIFDGVNVYGTTQYPSQTIFTYEGLALNGSFYVQNNMIILIDEVLNETVTNLSIADAYTPFM